MTRIEGLGPTGGPATQEELEKLLHLLVANLGGHGCWLIHNGEALDNATFNGFSLGRNRSIRLADIAEIFHREVPKGE
jgi:hypothetical protein